MVDDKKKLRGYSFYVQSFLYQGYENLKMYSFYYLYILNKNTVLIYSMILK